MYQLLLIHSAPYTLNMAADQQLVALYVDGVQRVTTFSSSWTRPDSVTEIPGNASLIAVQINGGATANPLRAWIMAQSSSSATCNIHTSASSVK